MSTLPSAQVYHRPQKGSDEVERTRRRLAGYPSGLVQPAELSSFANPNYKPIAETSTEGGATSPSSKLTPEQEAIAEANRARRKAISDSLAKSAQANKAETQAAQDAASTVHSSPHVDITAASGPMKVDASKTSAEPDLLK